MLTVRGWSPWRVGVKGTLESLLPVLVGAIAGVGLAVALVSLVGRSAPVGGEALRAALVNAGAAVARVGGDRGHRHGGGLLVRR